MILLNISIFMYLILKGTVADQNDTNNYTTHSGVQLWRVQGDLDEEVIDEFYERGAVTEDSFTWLAYPYLGDINRYLVKVASSYQLYATLTCMGWTFKENPINVLKISNDNPNNSAILIDGGMHGNERTAIISTLYFIDSIVKNFYDQPEYIQNKDWYIIPVLNPDGYEYSFDFDPLWRKNRRIFSDKCVGVDLGRNYEYHWALTGEEEDTCDSFYSGPQPFSEEETRAFKARSDVSLIKDGDVPIGREFEVSAGSSMKWMYHMKKVKLSYLVEAMGVDADDVEKRKEIEYVAKAVRARILKLAETEVKNKTTNV